MVDTEEAQDKLNKVQNAIFSANEDMDRFKLQMNWNQEELEQWALAAKQKEEDNLALQKYTRADDVKIKELRCERGRTNKHHHCVNFALLYTKVYGRNNETELGFWRPRKVAVTSRESL